MAASRRAVALICASAAAALQATMLALSVGRPWPVARSTRARNTRPKGSPKRKRTWVAPTVPSVVVNSFCCALRKTCPPAARTVNTAHNQDITLTPEPLDFLSRRNNGKRRPRQHPRPAWLTRAGLCELERRLEPQVIHTVDGFQLEAALFLVLQDVEGDQRTRRAQRPHLAVEVRKPRGWPSTDAEENVTLLHAGLLCRATGCHAPDQELATAFLRGQAQPGSSRARYAALGEKISHDGRQPVDRHEHVARRATRGVPHNQRADTDELALAIDEGGAAPGGMRRRRKNRFLEQVFPAAGELALGHHKGGCDHVRPAEACHQYGIALLELVRLAKGDRPQVQSRRRLEQAKAGFVVVAHHLRRQAALIGGDDLGSMRLQHQIADGEDQAVVADQDAGSLALGPERGNAAALRIDEGLDAHDGSRERLDRWGLRQRTPGAH